MIAAAGQAILHTAVAALLVEGLLRLWRVQDPGERLALRWVVIAAPAALTAACLVLTPWRAAPWFIERWSLFAGAHWDHLRLGGLGVASASSALLCIAGAALFLRDAVPFVADRLARTGPEGGLPASHPACASVAAALDALQVPAGQRPATVTVVDLESPVLLCTGVDRTAIVISTGTIARLDTSALQAALAHEIAHLAQRDPLTGWGLMAVRTIQCFNPVVQIVARQAVQDLERRADVAVTAQGRGGGLAAAVRRLALAADVHSDLAFPSEGGRVGDRALASAHRRALDARCQLLLEGVLPASQPHRAWRLALAGASLAVLLFLVV